MSKVRGLKHEITCCVHGCNRVYWRHISNRRASSKKKSQKENIKGPKRANGREAAKETSMVLERCDYIIQWLLKDTWSVNPSRASH